MLLLHINQINSALVCFQKKFKQPYQSQNFWMVRYKFYELGEMIKDRQIIFSLSNPQIIVKS